MQDRVVIVLGSGNIGMICANYLAQKGKSVLVSDSFAKPRGLGSIREFYQGFKTSLEHSVCHFLSKIAKDLNLSKFGFEEAGTSLRTVGLSSDGAHIILHTSENRVSPLAIELSPRRLAFFKVIAISVCRVQNTDY